MHVQQAFCSSTFVKIIDILRHDQQIARPGGVKPCQCLMRGVGFYVRQLLAPLVVEFLHQRPIAHKCLRRADIFDAMPLPQAVGAAKCRQTALGGDASARQDHDVANVTHPAPIAERAAPGKGAIHVRETLRCRKLHFTGLA